MPGLSGFQVLAQLGGPSTKAIPVVVVTSQKLSEKESAKLLGRASEIVSKEKLAEIGFADIIGRIMGDRLSQSAGVKKP
jgi:CheY-like chemotaxis protein